MDGSFSPKESLGLKSQESIQAQAKRRGRPSIRITWTDKMLEVMTTQYSVIGAQACQRILSDVTIRQVYNKAHEMGLRSPYNQGSAKKKIHEESPDVDAAIRRFYSNPIKRGTLAPFAMSINRPDWWVKRRASLIGATIRRTKPPIWSDPEEAILEENAALSPRTISKRLKAAGFNRTETAVSVKLRRQGISIVEERELAGIYSLVRVSQILGCDEATVRRWIRLSLLKAKTRNGGVTEATHSDRWAIKRSDLKSFLFRNPEAIDLRKVDRDLFLNMAFGDCA